MELCELLPEQSVSTIGVVPQPALKRFPGKARGERCEGSTGIEDATFMDAKTRGRQSTLTAMQRLHTHTRQRASSLMVA